MRKIKIISTCMMLGLSLLALTSCGKINFNNWARPSGNYNPNQSESVTPTPSLIPVETVTVTETVVQSDFEYNKLADGTYQVKKYNALDNNIKYLEIPNKAKDGTLITEIGEGAFSSLSNLESIYVGENITKIAKGAFKGLSRLKDITLPFIGDSKSGNYPFGYIFGESSFTNSIKVREDLYENNKYSEKNYYIPSSLDTVTITNEERVPYSAFRNITSLKYVNLNDGIKEIGNFAFSNTNVNNININSDTMIDLYSFEGANISNLGDLRTRTEKGCTYVGTATNPYRLLIKVNNSATTIDINPKCEFAPKDILLSCNKVKYLYIPSNLNNKIDLPESLELEEAQISSKQFIKLENRKINSLILNDFEEIEKNSSYADNYFSNVKSLKFSDDIGYVDYYFSNLGLNYNYYNNGYYIGTINNPYYMLVKTGYVNSSSPFNIHTDTVVIGNYAMANECYSSSITIPANVKYIGDEAFNSNLMYIYFNGNIEYLSPNAFIYAYNISNTNTYSNARYLGDTNNQYKWLYRYDGSSSNVITNYNTVGILANAFQSNQYISYLTLNDGLKQIGSNAFSYSKLYSLIIPSTVEEIRDNIVLDCNNLSYNSYGNGYYLGNNTNRYLYFAKRKASSTTLSINASCKFVEYNSLYDSNSTLTELIIPETAKATSKCSIYFDKLKNVEIPLNLFNNINCNNLEYAVINKKDKTLGNYSYNNNTDYIYVYSDKLKSLTINEEIKTVDFYNLDFLKSENGGYYIGTKDNPHYMLTRLINNSGSKINENTKVINHDVLYNDGYGNISNLIIPNSVEYISKNAFNYGTINSVSFEGIPDYIAPNAFNGMNNLTPSYENGKYLGTSYNPYYFLINANGSTIIHKDTKVIGSYAFANSNISSVTIPDGIISIRDYAFNNCRNLTSITIPSSVSEIGGSAFYGNSKLQTVKFNNGLKRIEWNAFTECDSLKNIVIPDTVTFVNSTTFDRSNNIEYIVLGKNIKDFNIYGDTNIKYFYYNGTKAEFDSIYRYINNTIKDKLYYYSSSKPTDTKNKYYYKDSSGNYKIWA